ncbi:MAG: hypothetical protein INQ03_15565 [Candidatus Heimdallarchaeota archaeon]|nr:hypothetical protein [Candidatus Heimdallarchaeota archaeon]
MRVQSLGNDKIVIKFPFKNYLFLEDEEILSWPFSSTILLTAFDLLRDDFLISKLQKTGGTLREYLFDRGLNKNVKILADTGIFALEFLKAQLPVNINFDIPDKLENKDIFDAYELIDPDFLVSPDEIILLDDSRSVMDEKTQIIKRNLEQTIDRFDKKKIYATIQGVETHHIQDIINTIEANEIKYAARGGLLPLIRNKAAFTRILKETEMIARNHGIQYLHGFGLPGIPSMQDFFIHNSYNSVDTSTLYYYTLDNQYLTNDGQLTKVRNVFFKDCDCIYCNKLLKLRNRTNSGAFSLNLFSHNANQLITLNKKLENDPEYLKGVKRRYYKRKIINTEKVEDYTTLFTMANNIDNHQRILTSSSSIHKKRISLIGDIVYESSRILVISSCSKSKKIQIHDQPDSERLNTRQKRRNEIVRFQDILYPARELYTGYNHAAIKYGVAKLRDRIGKDKVDHYILSAGFGLVNENQALPPYDTSFSGRSTEEIREMGQQLDILNSISRLPKYQLVYIALSNEYLTALGDISILNTLGNEVVVFNLEDNIEFPIINFQTKEFQLLEQEGTAFDPPLDFTLKITGNLLINFAKAMNRSRPSFTKYWHSIIDCNCCNKS